VLPLTRCLQDLGIDTADALKDTISLIFDKVRRLARSLALRCV
jgi:hypothetical protein